MFRMICHLFLEVKKSSVLYLASYGILCDALIILNMACVGQHCGRAVAWQIQLPEI